MLLFTREDRGGSGSEGSGRCGEPDTPVCELLLSLLIIEKAELLFVDELSSTEPFCSERMAASMLRLVMRVSGFRGFAVLMMIFEADDVALGLSEVDEPPMVIMDDLPLASEYRVPCILLVLLPEIS